MRLVSFLFVAAVAPAAVAFTPGGPVSPDGTRAVVDLPVIQHMKNVGGSDGAGLCVFTSVEHSARWQSIRQLDGFRRWMERKPGGGWPEKLDDMLARYCRETNAQLPPYIQHTGGDAAFLDAALKTDRMPCVTYAGRDDFYRSRIAHMVNLAHLDATHAAIVDNNRPGVWVWMTRAEFLQRWRDMGGGWAVVFLNPPPPPHPEAGSFQATAAGCICGDSCKCAAGKCPGGCPVQFGQCQVGNCRITAGRNPSQSAVIPFPAQPLTAEPIGDPPSDRHVWGMTELGWGWRLKDEAVPEAMPAVAENYGVDMSRINAKRQYCFRGVDIGPEAAFRAFGAPLADDSGRWHLTAVGDAAFLSAFNAAVGKLPADVKEKLLVQSYGPAEWPVELFKLPPGVSLRKPSPERTAADVGVSAGCSLDELLKLLQLPGGPLPAPKPVEPTKPADPAAPAPPATPDQQLPWWLCAVVAALLWFTRKPPPAPQPAATK